jgi:hypothetical protein
MKLYKILIYELLLIFASVLIFRSTWMMLDRIKLMNQNFGIIGSLVVGIIITLFAIVKLNKLLGDKK